MRVAFLGLGIMGRPMAANLVKAGHELSVWNRTPGKDVEGARSAASPAEAAAGAEVAWMCVSDTKAVESVLFGQRRTSRQLRPQQRPLDRKSTRLNSSHVEISYAVFCLKKKKNHE